MELDVSGFEAFLQATRRDLGREDHLAIIPSVTGCVAKVLVSFLHLACGDITIENIRRPRASYLAL